MIVQSVQDIVTLDHPDVRRVGGVAMGSREGVSDWGAELGQVEDGVRDREGVGMPARPGRAHRWGAITTRDALANVRTALRRASHPQRPPAGSPEGS